FVSGQQNIIICPVSSAGNVEFEISYTKSSTVIHTVKGSGTARVEEGGGSIESSPIQCNIDGSASSTSVFCVGRNEDDTDATNTINGTCNDVSDGSQFMFVNNIYLNDSIVNGGDNIHIDCQICAYTDGLTKYAIAYNNGSGWRNIDFGSANLGGGGLTNCDYTRFWNASLDLTVDVVAGTHYIRCMEQYWITLNITSTCSGASYADNDDISFIVNVE
ncbi:hypothetical protein K8R47_03020, partial [archaeon]|nr:hypothetical protein [archaeon]